MKLTKNKLKQIIKEELSKVLNESAILDWIENASQTSAGGFDAKGNMRGEAYVSGKELQKAKYILQDARTSEGGLKDEAAIAFLANLGPNHDDASPEARQFNSALQLMIHPSLRGTSADKTKYNMAQLEKGES